MKKLILGLACGLVVGGIGTWWALRPSQEPPAAEKAPESKPGEDTATTVRPVHVSPDQRSSMGLVVAAPRIASLAPEVQAFGRVLDPTPYVNLVAEEATARAAADASEKELDRTKKLLAAGGNASAQTVETAEAAAIRDRAAVASAHIRLLAGWGEKLADQANLATLQSSLAQGAALIRIDLLPGTTAASAPTTARVALLGSDESYSVEVLGPAPIADPQVQGASFLAVLREHSLPAGASLRVTLPGPGESSTVAVVPQSAIVYFQGSAWAFVAGKGDAFERRLVQLGRTEGSDIEIKDGIDRNDQVVTTGAQQLLSVQLATGGGPDER